MKRFIFVLAILSILLCACGKKPAEDTTPATQTVPATTEPEPEVETTEMPKTAAYRHPLTGAPLEKPFAGYATAVVINNIQNCLPQYGISNADFMYEAETEGGITRYLAIFTDLENTGSVGPVRSSRTFFNNVALSYQAPLFHCGGSVNGLKGRYGESSDNQIQNWQHVDGRVKSNYFFRDEDRYRNGGYAWEHTLFTTGEKLMNGMEAEGFLKDRKENVDYGLQFSEEVNLAGENAQTVTVTFNGGKTTTLTYNPDTGLYEAAQYGSAHMDAGSNQVMAYRNVLILYTDHWFANDGYYNRSYYDLIGSGKGHLAIGGKMVPITWHREDPYGAFTYTLEDGSAVTLGVGSSYVGIVTSKRPVTVQ